VMVSLARKDIVNPSRLQTLHLVSRCVRRAFLCGYDAYSGRDYSHRKNWVRDRLQLLVENFTIEVGGYAIIPRRFACGTRG
jgi:hypothetical protein